jgi:hypothetical protein
LDVRERRNGDGGVRLGEEIGKRGRENDLKPGHTRPKTEYVRTYKGTFDRTRVGAWVHG